MDSGADEELKAWARCIAAGVPDELYDALTPPELAALLEALAEREERKERAAALRAGLIAACVLNTMRQKKSDRVWKPEDFVSDGKPKSDVVILDPLHLASVLEGWGRAHNRRNRA